MLGWDFATWWIVWLIAFAFLLWGVGVKIAGTWKGVLIDGDAKVRLSRFQVVLWTWILVSAFFALALAKSTMNIQIPNELWALMGISVGSTTGAVIIHANKRAQQPDLSKMRSAMAEALQQMPSHGVLHQNEDPRKASLWEMFRSEEVTNYKAVDIGKVQMFFFTVAMVLGYVWTLSGFAFVPASDGGFTFPPLSQGLIVLLGISQAGYLGVKAAPHTPTA